MSKKPLVSIITPTYNHEKFIRKCIESVLNQSYDNWEQIIIDDGSSDKTSQIVTQYNDKRIKYIKQSNLGIFNLDKTYNKALKQSKGELIAILEGDDFWPCHKLKKQIISFRDSEVVLSYGKAAVTDINGEILKFIPESSNIKFSRNISQLEMLKNLLFSNFIPACTVMCRKDSLLSIGGFTKPKYSPTVDYPTWLNLCLKGRYFYCNDTLGYWRTHENQTTNQNLLEIIKAQKYTIEFFQRLPVEIKSSIDISTDELKINHQYQLASTFAYIGLNNLNSENWNQSKKNFNSAFKKGPLKLKLKSLLGILCANLKIKLKF